MQARYESEKKLFYMIFGNIRVEESLIQVIETKIYIDTYVLSYKHFWTSCM
jgi:hypothetical protein